MDQQSTPIPVDTLTPLKYDRASLSLTPTDIQALLQDVLTAYPQLTKKNHGKYVVPLETARQIGVYCRLWLVSRQREAIPHTRRTAYWLMLCGGK
jgi:hypothetical protein